MPSSPENIPKANHSDVPVIDSYCVLFHNGCHVSSQLPEGVSATVSGDGFFLFVPAHAKISKPIQINNLFDGSGEAPIQSRYIVMMEAGSSADLLIVDHTLSSEPCTYGSVTEIALGDAANLEVVRLQKSNSDTRMKTDTIVRQAAASRMKTHYVALGGGFIHNSLKVKLEGRNAEHTAAGLSLTKQTERVDNDIVMVHASPDCHSNQLFKNILSDTSACTFTGRIVVEKDAQKTTAYQRNSNILLNPKAKVNTRPQLEIYADDVKCSHGATVGQLSAEALFYLYSRGIGENEAKKLLLRAFALEALDGISSAPFKESVMQLIEQKL